MVLEEMGEWKQNESVSGIQSPGSPSLSLPWEHPEGEWTEFSVE